MSQTILSSRRRFLKVGALTAFAPTMAIGSLVHAASNDGVLRSLSLANDWINTPPLNAVGLRGKVVLINFWNYTCINWLRQLPYLRGWAAKYTRDGLVMIGVHSPEFQFEKNVDNVQRAVKAMAINYPVALDSEHAIWRAFNNQYWPALYFFDGQQQIRERHFGEGQYDRLERVIQKLLSQNGAHVSSDLLKSVEATGAEMAADWPNLRSPETYVGYERAENFASRGGALRDKAHVYTAPGRLNVDEWALTGDWTIGAEATRLNAAGGRIVYRFHARDVHLVMGPAKQGNQVRFRVVVDRAPPGNAHGTDIDEQGQGTVAEQRLYQLVRQSNRIADRTFEIEFLDPGVEAFSFTFG